MGDKIEFEDSKGRKWHPIVTARVIRDFEKVSGIGIFDAVFDTLVKGNLLPKNDEEITDDAVLAVARKLFGHLGNLTYLLFESCKTSDGRVFSVSDEFKQPVDYEHFCDAIGRDQVSGVLSCAVASLFDFFPEMKDIEKGGQASARPPSEDGPGETSTSSPQSQE